MPFFAGDALRSALTTNPALLATVVLGGALGLLPSCSGGTVSSGDIDPNIGIRDPGNGSSSGGNLTDGGDDDGSAPPPVEGGTLGLIQLSAGDDFTCALWSDGIVKCWGDNLYGQLGYGDTDHRGTGPGQMGSALRAVNLGTGMRTKRIRAGGSHICAILENGSVKCWGNNFDGALGYDDDDDRGAQEGQMGDALAAVDLGTDATAVDLGLGNFSSCALLGDGAVKCWGSSIGGELGYGDDEQRGGSEGLPMGDALSTVDIGFSAVRSIRMSRSSLYQHSCAVNGESRLKCWGGNQMGQLGLGDTNNRGDDAAEMGGYLRDVPVGNGVAGIALGFDATCARLDNGGLRCWGFNLYGQLGHGDNTARGGAVGNLPQVQLGTSAKVIDISMYDHTCAVFDNRTLKCWGRNDYGQLGLPDTENNRGDAPGEMGASLPTVDVGSSNVPLEVVNGRRHTCVRFANHRVKCWGDNAYGQLGYGDTLGRGADPATMGDALPFVDLGK